MQKSQSSAIAAALFFGLTAAGTAHAQQQQQVQLTPEAMAIVQQHSVQFTPAAVLFTPSAKTVSLDFVNPSDTPITGTVTFEFGIPATNSDGLFVDSVFSPTNPHSLVTWVQGVPTQISIPAHGKQTIPLTLTPPKDVKDGEYAGRVVVMVNNVPLQVPVVLNGSPTTTTINFNLRSVAPVFYRQGSMTSALEISKPVATVTGNTAKVCVNMHHSGLAHFEGTAHLTLKNITTGQEQPIGVGPLSVYDDLNACMTVNGLPAGKYSMNYSVDGDRQDLPESIRLPVTPVTLSVPFEITGAAAAPAPSK